MIINGKKITVTISIQTNSIIADFQEKPLLVTPTGLN